MRGKFYARYRALIWRTKVNFFLGIRNGLESDGGGDTAYTRRHTTTETSNGNQWKRAPGGSQKLASRSEAQPAGLPVRRPRAPKKSFSEMKAVGIRGFKI